MVKEQNAQSPERHISIPGFVLGMAIGSVVSRIILGFVFFFVVTPIGLLMRAVGRDPMNRELDTSMSSYREAISENKSNSFDKPF